MPEGQFSGEKKAYLYVTDDAKTILIRLDATLGDIPECGLTAAIAGDTFEAKPAGFKPRVVFWEGTLNGKKVRKSLTCNNTGTIYSDTSQALTIDGTDGATTGRRGEALSFIKLPTS